MWGEQFSHYYNLQNHLSHVFSLHFYIDISAGAVSSGKTAIAAKLAAESEFPFIRMISPTTMIGYNESRRCQTLLKVGYYFYICSRSLCVHFHLLWALSGSACAAFLILSVQFAIRLLLATLTFPWHTCTLRCSRTVTSLL